MRAVVTSEHKDIFTKLNSSGIALSGKTGTAQQSQTLSLIHIYGIKAAEMIASVYHPFKMES